MVNQTSDEEVRLGCFTYVPKGTDRHDAAGILLEDAKRKGLGRRGKSYRDDKCLVELQGLECLMADGGRVREMNSPMSNLCYHRVEYKGHMFIGLSKSPWAPFVEIRGSVR